MSYVVPREKPTECRYCPFMDRISYDCRLMYQNDYPDFKSQYENCPLIEIKFDMEQMETVVKMMKEK